MKKTYVFLPFFAFGLLITSCKNNDQQPITTKYTLTLDANGGKFADSKSKKTLSNLTSVSKSDLEVPSKSSSASYKYTFDDWYDGSSSSATKISFPYTLKSNTTFYAHYSATPIASYSVTLHANGGKFADNTDIHTLNNLTVLKSTNVSNYKPTFENHTFLGWYYSTTGTTDSVSFPVTLTKNIDIYARWSENQSYTVTLNPDGGTFSDGSTDNKVLTKQYTIDYSSLDKPSKIDEGSQQSYTFKGWSLDGETICSGTSILTKDITLTALYSAPIITDFKVTSDQGEISPIDGVYTISSAGTYTCSGSLPDGQILVSAGENDDIEIVLKGASITSVNKGYPINVTSANNVKIKAQKSYDNFIYDNRTINEEEATGGAIYADSDLNFVGQGSLHIEGNCNNGIHCEKDVKIKNLSLYCKGYNNGIRGENSISITSGNVQVVAVGGDGLKSIDNGLSSKGNQKGDITITGGTVDIDAYGDGIQAAHDLKITSGLDESGVETIPTVDIKTNKYAETGGITPETSTLYIRSTTNFSSTGNVIVYSYNSGGESSTVNADYKGTESIETGSRRYTYYVWKLNRPTGYQNLKIYVGESISSYTYSTSTYTYNSSYNMITIKKSTSSSLSFTWGVHDTSSDLSSKALKSENIVEISDGTITAKSYGNAIHANADSIIESTSTNGVGTINILGGDITLTTDDKGMHADNYLNIKGGTINVTTSYEGYEAANINIYDGVSHIYSTDDGLNAGSKDSKVTNKQINVYGGFVDVQVGSGDTDGIDSNGTFTQTGGIVVSRASANDQMSTALDTDGQSTISDKGVFIALGVLPEAAREKRLSCDGTTSTTPSISFSSNTTHTINSTYTFKVTMSYSSIYYYVGSSATKPTLV